MLPRNRASAQVTHPQMTINLDQVRRLAQLLTPEQRFILIRIGAPQWAGLRCAWQPGTQIETDVVQQLAAPAWGLVMPIPDFAHQYQLTPLGIHVVAFGLAGVLPLAEVR